MVFSMQFLYVSHIIEEFADPKFENSLVLDECHACCCKIGIPVKTSIHLIWNLWDLLYRPAWIVTYYFELLKFFFLDAAEVGMDSAAIYYTTSCLWLYRHVGFRLQKHNKITQVPFPRTIGRVNALYVQSVVLGIQEQMVVSNTKHP